MRRLLLLVLPGWYLLAYYDWYWNVGNRRFPYSNFWHDVYVCWTWRNATDDGDR